MTKSDYVKALGEKLTALEKHSFTKKEVEMVYDMICEMSQEHIALDGDGVALLPGIGSVVRVAKPARTARNPKTGEQIQVPAGHKLKFKVTKAAKDLLVA